MFIFLCFFKGKDSITIHMNEKDFYPKDFFWTEDHIYYGCLCEMHIIMPTHA